MSEFNKSALTGAKFTLDEKRYLEECKQTHLLELISEKLTEISVAVRYK
jgi:hypothetical protein